MNTNWQSESEYMDSRYRWCEEYYGKRAQTSGKAARLLELVKQRKFDAQLRREYLKRIKDALRCGEQVPQAILEQRPEYSKPLPPTQC